MKPSRRAASPVRCRWSGQRCGSFWVWHEPPHTHHHGSAVRGRSTWGGDGRKNYPYHFWRPLRKASEKALRWSSQRPAENGHRARSPRHAGLARKKARVVRGLGLPGGAASRRRTRLSRQNGDNREEFQDLGPLPPPAAKNSRCTRDLVAFEAVTGRARNRELSGAEQGILGARTGKLWCRIRERSCVVVGSSPSGGPRRSQPHSYIKAAVLHRRPCYRFTDEAMPL